MSNEKKELVEFMEVPRTLVISSVIDEEIARELVYKIMRINDIDAYNSSLDKDYVPDPIEMFINSAGGDVYAGFSIISAMNMSHTPIITYAMGQVFSMALVIFASGHYRVASIYSRFMYHSVQYGSGGDIIDHEDTLKETKNMQKIYDDVLLGKSKISNDILEKVKNLKKNYYFSPQRALSFGITDSIHTELPLAYDLKDILK